MTMQSHIVLWTAVLALSGAAQACPKTADRSLTGPAVGDDMVINGLPVQIQQVSSRDDAKSVLERVEKSWRDGGFKVKTQLLGHWHIVSALSAQCLTTLQLMDSPVNASGTVGFLAVGEPAKTEDRAVLVKKGDLPLPSGAQVVSSLAAKDGPRNSTTTVITSPRSVTDLRDNFVRGLEQRGYGNIRLHEVQGRDSLARAQIVTGQRGGDIVQVVIFDNNGTTAVINQGQAL
jgi:hypothetical protein